MAMPSSKNNEILPELRPVMPADLFRAALKGDSDVLIHRLGLPLEVRDEVQVTIEAADPDSHNTEPEHHTVVQPELIGSTTRSGENFLHLLYAGRQNKLAIKIFLQDMSLLKARNNKLETPLHCASHVGNVEAIRDLIRHAPDPIVVKDSLGETNENGDTALHLAAKNQQVDVVVELMNLDAEAAHKENKQGLSSWYIALREGNNSMVKTMLEVNPDLAVTQFSDGTFPVHVAASMHHIELVEHFWKEPDDAKLLDRHGRNLFHFAAEHNSLRVINALTRNGIRPEISKMVDQMINARDYEGNTPLHIAEMKEHRCIMILIWDKLNNDREKLLPNQKDKKPNIYMIDRPRYTNENVIKPPSSNSLEKIQVIGLGAALITTLAFGVAFTIPGGYNTADGTPVLGRRYAFKAFVVANTLAFVQAFASVGYVVTKNDPIFGSCHALYAEWLFASAARCMIAAFGLGSYVTLAGVSMPIAIIVLVVSLLVALPTTGVLLLWVVEEFFEWVLKWTSSSTHFRVFLVVTFALIFMFIFFLAFL